MCVFSCLSLKYLVYYCIQMIKKAAKNMTYNKDKNISANVPE